MNAQQNGIMMEIIFNSIAEQTGYQRKTTFASDFGIADAFGKEAIKDTYERAFKEWNKDIVYMTELCLALNWACWYHYEKGNIEISKLYSELYYKCDNYILEHFKGEDIAYFLRVTD